MTKNEILEMVINEFKTEGIEIAEDVALRAAKVGFGLAKKIVIATPNSIDDILLPIIAIVEPKVYEWIDKLDGQVG